MICNLVHLQINDFNGGVIHYRLATSTFDIIFNGNTYLATGDLLKITDSENSNEISKTGIKITMSGLDPAFLAEIDSGDASIIVFGMGRVGSGAYNVFHERAGDQVLGVDHDAEEVEKLIAQGLNVIRGSAIDPDFWNRINLNLDNVKTIVLAMPNIQENLFATRQLKDAGYTGKVAAVARYTDEIVELKKAGVHAAFNLYAEAGAGFAEHVCSELMPEESYNRTIK